MALHNSDFAGEDGDAQCGSCDDVIGNDMRENHHDTEPVVVHGPQEEEEEKTATFWKCKWTGKEFRDKRQCILHTQKEMRNGTDGLGDAEPELEKDYCKIDYPVRGGMVLNKAGLYESKDCKDNWWPVTLTGYDPVELKFSCRVHDKAKEPVWPVVFPNNIKKTRRDPAATVAKREGMNYNSKAETGFVGLRNQGATCYLNALLQCLFHLSYFRTGIYKIHTEDEHEVQADPKFIPLALQKLFYAMEFLDEPPSTNELTKSFGWRSRDTSVQHDVQEFMRVLLDTLSDKINETDKNNNVIERLFRGKLTYYTRCTDVDYWEARGQKPYESRRDQEFYDMQLVIRGTRDIRESFRKYCEQDVLDGENKYEVEREGQKSHHPAVRGCIFKKLPPVLMIHLRRFDFCMETLRQIKINDEWRFEESIDLSEFVDPGSDAPGAAAEGASPAEEGAAKDELNNTTSSIGLGTPADEADNRDSHTYVLHSVMVHSGAIDFGHYICYVRPGSGEEWFKFDDTTVSKVTEKEAIEGQYGGKYVDSWGYTKSKTSSAYLLIYIRKSLAHQIVYPPREEEKPLHLKRRFEEEQRQEEEREQQREDRRMHIMVLVELDSTIAAHVRRTCREVVNKDLVPDGLRIKVRRGTSTREVKEEIERRGGPPPDRCRLWLMKNKDPLTGHLRPGWTVTDSDEEAIDGACRPCGGNLERYPELYVYAEKVPEGESGFLARPSVQALILVKLYDAAAGLTYLGPWVFDISDSHGHHATTARELADWVKAQTGSKPSDLVALWEEEDAERELRPLLVAGGRGLSKKLHGDLNLGTGSVVVAMICKDLPMLEYVMFKCGSVPEELRGHDMPTPQRRYSSETDRVQVRFLPLPKDAEQAADEGVVVELHKDDGYKEIQQGLARALGLADPSVLRFTRKNMAWQDGPESTPVRTTELKKLKGSHYNSFLQPRDKPNQHRIYYEVLDRPVEEVEALVTLSVEVRDACHRVLRPEGPLEMRCEMECTFLGVVEAARGSLPADCPLRSCPVEDLQLVVVCSHAIQAIHRPIPEELRPQGNCTYRVEPATPDPPPGPEGSQWVHCVHTATVSRNEIRPRPELHSDPFLLLLGPEDTVAEVHAKLPERLGITPAPEGQSKGRDDVSNWRLWAHVDYELVEIRDPDIPVLRQMEQILKNATQDRSYFPRRQPEVWLAFEHPAPPNRNRRNQVREECVRFRSTATSKSGDSKTNDSLSDNATTPALAD
eukprot:TRINITY_DN50289_c0_g1_i1.p1 TRINITY_DN50289_c0_g1~~TRINITY_DN50289_c0_g1_i1.p1  ORF type:complete len:1237 (+),score=340.17 TRINITY_DN50289_c0_g1_i1:83-3793(+)